MGPNPETPEFSQRCILVVDDVRFTRSTLTRMLNQIGNIRVLEAEDGEAALGVLERNRVDSVISDLDMPRMNGLELLKAIRVGTGSIPRDLRVVFLTGHSELEHMGPAVLLDLNGFLAKPIAFDALQRCLQEQFDAPKPERAIESPDYYAAVDLNPAAPEVIADATSSGTPAGRPVSLAALPENGVLARDLLYANGRLLLRAGSKLSAQIIGRLQELSTMTPLSDTVWLRD